MYGGDIVDLVCEGVAGTDPGDSSAGVDDNPDPDEGVDETGEEVDWSPELHILAETEPLHYSIGASYIDHVFSNPSMVYTSDDTIAWVDDGCTSIMAMGDLSAALGLAVGDRILRANGLSLHEENAVATLLRLDSETMFVVDVEHEEAAAWFVRPVQMRYVIE